MIPKPREMSSILSVFRDTERRSSGSVVVSNPKYRCVVCKTDKLVQDMNMIPNTGVVRNVLDCVCKRCEATEVELAKVARIVCAKCRETVMIMEPGKEPSGFEWKSGKCYHVANCPVCAKDPGIKSSTVAEKLVFYKENGIPYA